MRTNLIVVGILLIVIVCGCSIVSADEVLSGESVIDMVEGLLTFQPDGYLYLGGSNETVNDIWLEPELDVIDSDPYYYGNESEVYYPAEYDFSEEKEYPKNAYVYIDEESVFCPVNISIGNQDLRLGVSRVTGKGGECFNFYAANNSTSWSMIDSYMRFTFQQDDFEFSHGFNVSGSSMSKITVSAAYLVEEGIEVDKPFQVKVELLSKDIDYNFEDNSYVGLFKIEEKIGDNIYDELEDELVLYNSDYSGENNSSVWYCEGFNYLAERGYYNSVYTIKRII